VVVEEILVVVVAEDVGSVDKGAESGIELTHRT